MKLANIRVPAELLLAPDLSPSAKLVWMAQNLGPVEPGRQSALTVLAARSGLSRPTVKTALAQLHAAGWGVASGPSAPAATGPGAPAATGPGAPATGPGAPAASGPGAAAATGPGAAAASGPGAPAASGPGAPASGPGAPAASGPGAPAASGPGAPAATGPGAPAASGPGAPASGPGAAAASGPGAPASGPGAPAASGPGAAAASGPGAPAVGPGAPAAPGPGAQVPAALLSDTRVSIAGRLLYGILQLTPGYRPATGASTTYAALRQLTHLNLHAIKAAILDLAQPGWLTLHQPHQQAPFRFTLHNPVADAAQAEADRARTRIEESRRKGETIMQAYLTLLIDCDNYQDNVRPGFLVNPASGELLEFDRYYPDGVAFEFNGPQHYRKTDFCTERGSAKQQLRDMVKLAICARRSIHLVVIHADDLTLVGMQQKVGNLLPLRDLVGHEPLIKLLETAGDAYRRSSRHARATARTQT